MNQLRELEEIYKQAKLNKNLYQMYQSANDIGAYYQTKGDFSMSFFYHDNALKHVNDILKQKPKDTEAKKLKAIELYEIAQVSLELNPESQESLRYLIEGKKICQEVGLYEELQNVLVVLFKFYHNKDDYKNCLIINEESLNILQKMENDPTTTIKKDDLMNKKANVYLNFGIIYTKIRPFERAEEYLLKALQIHENLEKKYEEGYDLGALGALYLEEKDYDKAHTIFEKARRIFERGSWFLELINIMGDIAHTHYLWGNDCEEKSREHFKISEQYFQEQYQMIMKHCATNKVIKERNEQNKKLVHQTLQANSKQLMKLEELKREKNPKKRLSIIKELIDSASKHPIVNNKLKLSMLKQAKDLSEKKDKAQYMVAITTFLVDLVISGDSQYEKQLDELIQESVSFCQIQGDMKYIQLTQANWDRYSNFLKSKDQTLVQSTPVINLVEDSDIKSVTLENEKIMLKIKGEMNSFYKKFNEMIEKKDVSLDLYESIKRRCDSILEDLQNDEPEKKKTKME